MLAIATMKLSIEVPEDNDSHAVAHCSGDLPVRTACLLRMDAVSRCVGRTHISQTDYTGKL